MNSFIQVVRDITLLLIRLGLGGIMIWHGLTRWILTTDGVPAYIDYLTQFGVPFPTYSAWGVTILELVGGVFLILGALTPLVAILALVQQVLTISYTNYWRGPDLVAADGSYAGGWEYNVVLGLLALVLLSFGPGRVAIDRLFRRPKSSEVADDDPSPAGSDSGSTSMASASTW
ncbi:MAG: DoxX family protein [Microlunatus sp.]|nr:DoxX family protein [Microlunatus sp.]MDN5770015.1 DoxX family protein [Microlunatus sp.]MDN5803744.1 DoxX family protein [Microlunatus sp.]